MTAVAFWCFAGVAIIAAFLCITRRSPVASALWLVLTLFALAVLFVLLDAHFIAAVQVLVYAGAIMVLFLFVIMLLNLHRLREMRMFAEATPVSVVVGLLLVALFVFVFVGVGFGPPLALPDNLTSVEGQVAGNSEAVAWELYRTYLLPFEIASVFLLVAMIGAVVLGRKE